MKFVAVILCLAIQLEVTAFAQDCTISSQEEQALIAKTYSEFDQSMGKGWRAYADRGCYALCSKILDRYVTEHRATMLDWQISVVTWHAGQMYAYDGVYDLARLRFRATINPNEPKDTPILWNDYVNATLAFLDKDMDKLVFHRNRIAEGPEFNGSKANLAVVDGLIRCFDKPYAVAYGSGECRK